MENWEDIHEDFAKEWYDGTTFQQNWKKRSLTYQDAQELIPLGFRPNYYDIIKQWKNHHFTPQQTQSWIETGLASHEHEFAAYLRWKGYRPNQELNLEKLKKELNTAQNHLDYFYPPEKRNAIKEINISYKNLTGSLDLNDFVNLEKLNCKYNKLTALNLTNCRQLKKINCSNNNLSDLKLPSLTEQLIYLSANSNKLSQKDLSMFSHFVNLETLYIINNRFVGSLKPLQNLKKLKWLDISNTDIDGGLECLPDSLETFYCSVNWREEAKCKNLYSLVGNSSQNVQDYKQWRKLNFSEEEIKEWINAGATLNDYNLHQKWEEQNFTLQETNQWIIAGAKAHDYEFVAWFRDTKKLGPEWITNYKEDYQTLSERFKKYGLCSECNQLNTGEQWCQGCNASRLQENFSQWTSNNPKVNEFIQKYQLAATDVDKFLEWIPYEQFAEIEYLAEGGFGKVYKAKWTEGNIHHWDTKNKQWHREKDSYNNYKMIVLKSLTNSRENTDFLQETEKHKIIDDWFDNIVSCYGLSQDPQTGNYLMVMQYMPEGNLRNYLIKNNRELKEKSAREKEFNQEIEVLKSQLEFEKKEQDHQAKNKELQQQSQKITELNELLQKKQQELSELHSGIVSLQTKKLSQLVNISRGLKDLHQKKLIHRDFHSGNILKGIKQTECLITDLGLCKPANETSKEDKIFGVMPYVALEVLNSKPYTQASDIYSFGIVAYEMLTGLPPYYERAHDLHLAIEICQGLRPKFNIKIPQLLESLINRCWDADPKKRPTASELERSLRDWEKDLEKDRRGEYKDTEFKKQLQAAEEHNKTLPDNIKFPDYQKKMHKRAIYHSQLLPTKEITRLLQDSKQFDLEIPANLGDNADFSHNNAKTDQELTTQTKRQLSITSQTINAQEKTKLSKIIENQAYQTEPMAIDNNQNWNNLPSFTPQLIQTWTNHHFTPTQAQEWININPLSQQNQAAQEPAFYAWLSDTKNLTPEQVLNHGNLNTLKQEYQATQQQAHVLHQPN